MVLLKDIIILLCRLRNLQWIICFSNRLEIRQSKPNILTMTFLYRVHTDLDLLRSNNRALYDSLNICVLFALRSKTFWPWVLGKKLIKNKPRPAKGRVFYKNSFVIDAGLKHIAIWRLLKLSVNELEFKKLANLQNRQVGHLHVCISTSFC